MGCIFGQQGFQKMLLEKEKNEGDPNLKIKEAMGRNERILALLAALLFTIVGFMELEKAEHSLLIATMTFFAAAIMLYFYFGKKGISSCSFAEINERSKTLVLESEAEKISKKDSFKVGTVTLLAILVSFGLGFGVGKLIYHLIH